MFGKIMYYDKTTIDEYKAIIKGQKNLKVEEYEVSNDKGASVDSNSSRCWGTTYLSQPKKYLCL